MLQVSELSPTWLSQHVSIVSQEPTLFGRSVKRNIMYGLEGTDREPSDEDIEEAARLANAASFIEVRSDVLLAVLCFSLVSVTYLLVCII